MIGSGKLNVPDNEPTAGNHSDACKYVADSIIRQPPPACPLCADSVCPLAFTGCGLVGITVPDMV